MEERVGGGRSAFYSLLFYFLLIYTHTHMCVCLCVCEGRGGGREVMFAGGAGKRRFDQQQRVKK